MLYKWKRTRCWLNSGRTRKWSTTLWLGDSKLMRTYSYTLIAAPVSSHVTFVANANRLVLDTDRILSVYARDGLSGRFVLEELERQRKSEDGKGHENISLILVYSSITVAHHIWQFKLMQLVALPSMSIKCPHNWSLSRFKHAYILSTHPKDLSHARFMLVLQNASNAVLGLKRSRRSEFWIQCLLLPHSDNQDQT